MAEGLVTECAHNDEDDDDISSSSTAIIEKILQF